MKILKATRKHSKDISKLMLKDLGNPPKEFPQQMIDNFVKHAQEESIIQELKNPKMIGFIALKNEEVVGFIVGYTESQNNSMIHYINGDSIQTKKLLLNKFINECKLKGMKFLTTDSFDFMESHTFFEDQGFKIIGEENLGGNLIMFWRRYDL